MPRPPLPPAVTRSGLSLENRCVVLARDALEPCHCTFGPVLGVIKARGQRVRVLLKRVKSKENKDVTVTSVASKRSPTADTYPGARTPRCVCCLLVLAIIARIYRKKAL